MPKLIVFVIVSIGIIFISWRYLGQPRSYGFFRFFAFESLLTLILLNTDDWFKEPFSIIQIVSWMLLAISIVMVTLAFQLLHTARKLGGGISVLIKHGIYRYIRHPLYGSLLFLAWGAYLKNPSLMPTILVIAVSFFLMATAKAEEKENLQKFGEIYMAYMKITKMFIPGLI